MTRAKEMRDLPLAIDVSASGNVGIGTNNPLVNLDMGGTSPNDQVIALRQNGVSRTTLGITANYGVRVASPSDASATGAMFEVGQNNASDGTTYQNTRFNVLYNGRVGIGTDAPEYPLQVSGSNVTSGGGQATLGIYDTGTAYDGTNPGGGITFRGRYNNGGSTTNFATVQGIKENATDGNYDTALRFTTRANGGNLTEKMRIDHDGKVGIGTSSPLRNLSVIGSDTSSSGYKDIAEFLEPNTTGGTVSVNFGVANGLNNLGKIDFTYVGAGSTSNWVSIGFHSNDNKLKVFANGLVEVASYLKSKKGTIQTVVNQPTIYTSANPVNTWAEVNSNFRVSITPRFASGTKILGTYSIPINPTGAANILMAIQPWYSTNGGTTKTLLNQGGPSGSRLSGSHAWFRSSNGYDGNDMQNHVVHFGYTHSATTTLTWGFYFRSEGSNTTYFCQSNGNSSLWGWTAPLYMELREVEVA